MAAVAAAYRGARDDAGVACEPRADPFYVGAVAAGRLTEHQRSAFDAVLVHVTEPAQEPSTGFFRVEAEAAAGKTLLANALAAAVRARGGHVVCSAYTAKAATNYGDGSTCHRAFNLNVTTPSEMPVANLALCGSNETSRAGARLALAELVIVDEFTMMKVFRSSTPSWRDFDRYASSAPSSCSATTPSWPA